MKNEVTKTAIGSYRPPTTSSSHSLRQAVTRVDYIASTQTGLPAPLPSGPKPGQFASSYRRLRFARNFRFSASPPATPIRRPFGWLAIKPNDRQAPQLVGEWVKCGKPSCHCRRGRCGRRHEPYWYLRYEEWDDKARTVRFRREYVPNREVDRVRRWIRCARAENTRTWAIWSYIRRCLPRPKPGAF